MGTSGRRYTAEFRAEAVKQVIDRGHPVREVAARLGVSAWSLYEWLRARLIIRAELLATCRCLRGHLQLRRGHQV